MLIVTTTTLRKIWTAGLDSIKGRLQDCFQPRPCEPRLLLHDLGFYMLGVDCKWHKNSLAGSMFIGRQSTEAVSPIHQLFNCDLHHTILMCESVTPAANAQSHPPR